MLKRHRFRVKGGGRMALARHVAVAGTRGPDEHKMPPSRASITVAKEARRLRRCETIHGRPEERGRPRWPARVPRARRRGRRCGCRCSAASGPSGSGRLACRWAPEKHSRTPGASMSRASGLHRRRRAGHGIRAAADSVRELRAAVPGPTRAPRSNRAGQITMVAPGSTGNTGPHRLIWAMMLEPQVSRCAGRSRMRRPRWVSPLGCRRRMRRSAPVAAGSSPSDSIIARNEARTCASRMKERRSAPARARNCAGSSDCCASGGACGANASQAIARACATRADMAGMPRNIRISP